MNHDGNFCEARKCFFDSISCLKHFDQTSNQQLLTVSQLSGLWVSSPQSGLTSIRCRQWCRPSVSMGASLLWALPLSMSECLPYDLMTRAVTWEVYAGQPVVYSQYLRPTDQKCLKCLQSYQSIAKTSLTDERTSRVADTRTEPVIWLDERRVFGVQLTAFVSERGPTSARCRQCVRRKG